MYYISVIPKKKQYNMETIPILKLVYDRRKRATSGKEGAVELRITYNRVQRFITTGVRLLPKQWKNGRIINRLDAFELQHSLDTLVADARKIINEQSMGMLYALTPKKESKT